VDQYFGGEVCSGCGGGGRNELVAHVIRELVVEGVGIAGEGEENGLEQAS
jgi:hypothetical protein